jgi:tRNA threonylcarbamoyladenosine biosynthesis protein TsaB
MSTIILGIETATDACSVAIVTPTQSCNLFVIEPQAHAKLLLGMVDQICAQAGVALQDIDAFAFGSGPGSFTGVRIAASVVQGLAFGVSKPVIAVSSLQALAQQAYNVHSYEYIAALLDARMQEIYCGSYKANANGLVAPMSEDVLKNPAEFTIDAASCVAVGTGVAAYSAIIKQHNPNLIIDTTILHPRAQEIVQLAADLYKRGEVLQPSEAIPTYIRNDVAKKSKKNPD